MATEQLDDGKLREVLDGFNRHHLDDIMTFFADDAVLESPRGPHPWGTRFEGKEAVRKGLAARFEGIPTSTTARTGTSSAATEAHRNGR